MLLRRAFRFCFLCVFTALSVGIGVFSYWMLKSPSLRQAAGVTLTGGLAPSKAFPGVSDLNVLLLGKDEDRDRKGRVVKTRGRTDAILLAHFDFKDRRVNMLSIPRDTLARIPGYHGRHKINSANQYGGPSLAIDAVQGLIGVKADDYVLVDYSLFSKIVDMMGGIPVTVDKPLDYDDSWGKLHIHLKPGPQIVNGSQCLGLVRYRKSNDGHGDTDQERIARQQMVLASTKAKLASPRTLMILPDIFSTVTQQTQTTLSVPQALCLANFARSLGAGKMRMEVLPSTPTRSALRIDKLKARQLVNEMFSPGLVKKSG